MTPENAEPEGTLLCCRCGKPMAGHGPLAECGSARTMENFHRSGVWYCRTHGGTVNEDEPHGDEDECPWLDSSDDADYACDWTELLYEVRRV